MGQFLKSFIALCKLMSVLILMLFSCGCTPFMTNQDYALSPSGRLDYTWDCCCEGK